MKKVELEVVKSEGFFDEYSDGTIVRRSVNKTYEFTATEGKIIYYTNDYDIFSSQDRKGKKVDFAIQVVKINKNSVEFKNIGEYSYKTLIFNDDKSLKALSFDKLNKGFKVKEGQTIWFNTCSCDVSLDYYIKVNKIELD